ncbi:MAG: phosphoribosylanthranilate isomerase [Lachnospiraceae bacterium]|nr:phosphoribosylanthranilate isomerase [Lachnospiraceae bacterium]
MNIAKICGLKTEDEIRWTAEAGADLGGIVVFYEKSKRNVDIDRAKELVSFARGLDKPLKMVAVCVSPSEEQLEDMADAGFSYVQIHGELKSEVLSNAPVPIIRAFNVSNMAEFEKYKDDKRIAGFIFDAGIPGSGIGFDYELLKALNLGEYNDKPLLLAGGLSSENVGHALGATGLKGADTSSGVENETGEGKSRDKIFAFVKEVKK